MKTYYLLICLLLGIYATPVMSCKMIITRQIDLSESYAVLLGSVQGYVKGTDGLNNWGLVVKITDQLPARKPLPPLVEVFQYSFRAHCAPAGSYSFDRIKAAFPIGSQVSVVAAAHTAQSPAGRVVLTISPTFGAMQINYNSASLESTFDFRRYFELLYLKVRPITDPIIKANHEFEYFKDISRLANAKSNLEKEIILSRLMYADPDPKFAFEQLLNSSIGNGEKSKALRLEREKWLATLRRK